MTTRSRKLTGGLHVASLFWHSYTASLHSTLFRPLTCRGSKSKRVQLLFDAMQLVQILSGIVSLSPTLNYAYH